MKRGVTLLEVMVASGLALVALSLTATLLYATSTATARNQTRVDLQQQAVRAVNALAADLSQCTPAGVGLLYTPDPDDPTVVCLHKVADVNNVSPPAPVFDRRFTVYWSAEGGFYRRLLPDGQSPTLSALGLDPLSQTRASRGGTQGNLLRMLSPGAQGRTRLAEGVRSLQIVSGADLSAGTAAPYQELASPPSVTNPVTLSLILEKEVKNGIERNARGNPCETFRLQRTIWFRDAE